MTASLIEPPPDLADTVKLLQLNYCCARLDNRQHLIYTLRLSKFATNEEIILAAYQQWQLNFAQHLQGDFAIVLFDPRHQAYILVRDPMGCRPLFYYHYHTKFSFSDDVPALLSQLASKPAINLDWVATLLTTDVLMTSSYTDQTMHQHVYRVNPGECLVISAHHKKSKRFWDLDVETELHYTSEQAYIDEYKERLDRAVFRRVQLADRVGSELSGGLDSSSVAVLAKRYQPELHGFSHIQNPNETSSTLTDEKPFAKAVAEFADIHPMHWVDGGDDLDVDQLFEQAVAYCGMPCQGTYPIFAATVYQCAQRAGVNDLLSGFGGDQGVTSQGYGYIKDLLRAKHWHKYWQYCKQKHKNSLKAYKAFLFAVASRHLPTLSLLGNFKRKGIIDLAHFGLSKSLADHVVLPNRFETVRLKHGIEPVSQREQIRRAFVGKNSWHVRQRIESSALIAKHYGLQISYPLLDVEFLQFYVSLPGWMKYKPGVPRYMIRQAMNGLLPGCLINRFDKTGGTVQGTFYHFEKMMARDQPPQCQYAHCTSSWGGHVALKRRQWQFIKMLQIATKT